MHLQPEHHKGGYFFKILLKQILGWKQIVITIDFPNQDHIHHSVNCHLNKTESKRNENQTRENWLKSTTSGLFFVVVLFKLAGTSAAKRI